MEYPDQPLPSLIKVPLTPRDNYRVSPNSGRTLKIAHISDTHLGLRERTVYVPTHPESSEPVKTRVSSFEKFRGLLKTLQKLDPDVIIHTGDITDQKLDDNYSRYKEFKSKLPGLSSDGLLLYTRGNHDQLLSRTDLCELFSGWEVLSLEENGPVPLVNKQIIVYGTDYRKDLSSEPSIRPSTRNTDGSVRIGVFHQSIRRISRSYDANTKLNELPPSSKNTSSFYDLLLLGHMHTNTVQQEGECLLIDGGSTLGLNTPSTVGLLTFSEAGSHYQRFPLWLE